MNMDYYIMNVKDGIRQDRNAFEKFNRRIYKYSYLFSVFSSCFVNVNREKTNNRKQFLFHAGFVEDN